MRRGLEGGLGEMGGIGGSLRVTLRGGGLEGELGGTVGAFVGCYGGFEGSRGAVGASEGMLGVALRAPGGILGGVGRGVLRDVGGH